MDLWLCLILGFVVGFSTGWLACENEEVRRR